MYIMGNYYKFNQLKYLVLHIIWLATNARCPDLVYESGIKIRNSVNL